MSSLIAKPNAAAPTTTTAIATASAVGMLTGRRPSPSRVPQLRHSSCPGSGGVPQEGQGGVCSSSSGGKRIFELVELARLALQQLRRAPALAVELVDQRPELEQEGVAALAQALAAQRALNRVRQGPLPPLAGFPCAGSPSGSS